MGIILIILGLLLIAKGFYDDNKRINKEIKTGKRPYFRDGSEYFIIGFIIFAIGASIS